MTVQEAERIREILRSSLATFKEEVDRSTVEAVHVQTLLSHLQRNFEIDDVGSLAGKRETKAFRSFLSRVWHPLQDRLRADMDVKTEVSPEIN